jgi:hypothetical protein
MEYLYIGLIILFLGIIVVIAKTMDEEDMKK